MQFVLGLLSFLAVANSILIGCARAPSAPRIVAPPGPKTVTASDSKCTLTIPPDWSEDNELYPGAELQVSNKKEELFAVVLKESKKDFDEMTRDKYSRITRRSLAKSLKSSKTAGPANPLIGGVQALQYQIAGKLDGMEVVYLHTALEGKSEFFQILAWTQKSKFESVKPTLDQVINSFHAVEPPSAAEKP